MNFNDNINYLFIEIYELRDILFSFASNTFAKVSKLLSGQVEISENQLCSIQQLRKRKMNTQNNRLFKSVDLVTVKNQRIGTH